MNKTIQNPEHVTNAMSFIALGFKDYIASRVLLNQGFLLQGACLASTSMEKYFKAVIALTGKTVHGHLNKNLIEKIKLIDVDLYNNLNETFLRFLEISYKFRYLDNLPDGYSISIIQFPTLAELDYSINKIDSQFSIISNGTRTLTNYQRNWNERTQQLVENNYLFQEIDKNIFIESRESQVYAIKILPPFHIVEATYTAKIHPHDGDFCKEVIDITPNDPNTSLKGLEILYPHKAFKLFK